MRYTIAILASASVLGIAAGAWLPGAGPSAEARGKDLFERRCTGCHALDREKEGPRLRGVFGRKAGSVESFGYSDALKNSGIVWNAETLDRWLADPAKVAPDNDMAFHVESGAERSDLIAYLKSLP